MEFDSLAGCVSFMIQIYLWSVGNDDLDARLI